MKKTILTSALAAFSVLFIAGTTVAAPIAFGPWDDYEYYQKTSNDPNGYKGQLMEEGDKFNFYFDLAFLGFGSAPDPLNPTNSQLTLKNDVSGYGDAFGTIPVGDVWAAVSVFSIDPQPEGFKLKVDAFANGNTYNLGLTQFDIGPNTQEGTFTFKFAGSLLSDWQLDPYGVLNLKVSHIDPGVYNDFNLTEVGVGVTAVPEPTTMLLFGAGLAGLAGISRRKKN
jgi:hypothetical protein